MKDYVKYTGIGLQMFVIILLGSWGGKELNDHLGYKQPVITAAAALLSIFLAMYYVFRQVRK